MNALIVTTVGVTVGSNEIAKLVNNKGLQIDPLLGGFILGAFLFGFDMIAPKVTSYFCILLIITALLVNGQSLALGANRLIKGGK